MRLAVVTIAHGRHQHLERQADSLMAGSRAPDQYVVVAMNDPQIAPLIRQHPTGPAVIDIPTDELGLPLARARNTGVRYALEHGADVVILLDVDCLAGRDLVKGYADAVQRAPSTIWSGPVTYLPPTPSGGVAASELVELDNPHPARPAPDPGELVYTADPDLFWSLSFALSGDTWQNIGGFCEEYVGYGAEDTDLARTSLLRGVGLGWAGTPRAYHQYHPTTEPPVQHLESILRNATVFHRRWGAWPMMGWLQAFERDGYIVRTPRGWALHPSRCSPADASGLR